MATTAEGNPKNENKTREVKQNRRVRLGARLALAVVGGDSVVRLVQLTGWMGGASSIPAVPVALLWLNLALGHLPFSLH